MRGRNEDRIPTLRWSGPGYLHAPARAGDAGMDLAAYLPDGPVILHPGQPTLIPTGVKVELPEGHLAMVLPRSGLALRRAVTVGNAPGLIDQGYRGDIGVILINHGGAPMIVSPGDRIAQLIVLSMGAVELEYAEELSESERGSDGFGSTGVAA